MKIKAKILEKTRSVELPNGATVADLFSELGENTETYIVERSGKVIIEKDKLRDGNEVELIKIVSGG